MKKLLLFLFLGIMVSGDLATAATLKVNTRDFTSEPTQRRRTTLTLLSTGPLVSGPWLLAGDSVSKFTDTNGIAYYSNVLAANYRLDIAGAPGRSFPIAIADTNGIVNAADVVNSTNANASYYTAAQVDALIAAVPGGNGGTSGALTNNETRAITFGGAVTVSNTFIATGDMASYSSLSALGSITAYGGSIGVLGDGDSFVGNGELITNLPGSSITGDLTNNTTGNAAYATTAGNATNVNATSAIMGSVVVTNGLVGNGSGLTNLSWATNAINATNLMGGAALASSLIASNNSFGAYGINVSSAHPGINTYGSSISSVPYSDNTFSWMAYQNAPFTDAWGANNYNAMRFGESSFRGLMVNNWSEANPNNNMNLAGVAVGVNALAYAGNASTMRGLPMDAKAKAAAMPYPWTVISSWNDVNLVMGEADVTAQLRNATTNGLLYAFTNQGLPLWYHIDENCNWITNNRIAGDLAIDTSAFPSGTNFLWRWQTNGWKFSLTHYPWRIPTNAYNRLESVGQVLPGTANSSPVATPVTIARDIAKFYEWGIDMFRGSDMQYDAGYQLYWTRTIADLIVNPIPSGGVYGGFWQEQYAQGRTLRPMAFHWMTPRIGGTDPAAMLQANVLTHDDANVGYGPWVGYITAANTTVGYMNKFRAIQTNEVPLASPGCFPSGYTLFEDAASTTLAQLVLTMASMQWGVVNICTLTNYELDAYMPIMCQQMTNAGWISSRKDLTDISTLMFDNGYTNTSGWKRRLANNDYLVFLSNESNNTANVTYTWQQLGVPETQNYLISDMWNGTNFGVFNRNHTLAIAATSHYWLRLSPVVQEVLSWEAADIDSGLVRNALNYSPAPHYYESGVKQTTGGYGSLRMSIPEWATNVVLESNFACVSASDWTNGMAAYYYSPAGRVTVFEGIENRVAVGASGSTNWTYTFTFPATNAAKVIGIQLRPSTNTAVRYLGPSVKRTMR